VARGKLASPHALRVGLENPDRRATQLVDAAEFDRAYCPRIDAGGRQATTTAVEVA